jgi:hypothetical protein
VLDKLQSELQIPRKSNVKSSPFSTRLVYIHRSLAAVREGRGEPIGSWDLGGPKPCLLGKLQCSCRGLSNSNPNTAGKSAMTINLASKAILRRPDVTLACKVHDQQGLHMQ